MEEEEEEEEEKSKMPWVGLASVGTALPPKLSSGAVFSGKRVFTQMGKQFPRFAVQFTIYLFI